MRKTLIVVDDDALVSEHADIEWLSFDRYLADYPKAGEPRTRIINLCDTARYLSRGYYCSLLAEARRHSVLPSVSTINDLRESEDGGSALRGLDSPLERRTVEGLLAGEAQVTQLVCFGRCADARWQRLARQAFRRYPAPILELRLALGAGGPQLGIHRIGYAQLDETQRAFCNDALAQFTRSVWRSREEERRLRWELALLANPAEQSPPSDAAAIRRFVRAGAELGIRVDVLGAEQLAEQLNQYDALFLRETTAIDHHTYRLARQAEREGLVVIDDPQSILRCCNKIYLHDAFSYTGVPALPTQIVAASDDPTLEQLEERFGYPLVLKLPEGSFSRGVFRVQDRAQLRIRLDELLAETTLVLAQAYCYTPFDWRVGVLAGKAIYACRYHMARDHWQIYNHARGRNRAGGFDTLPTFEVPPAVLKAAVKAAAVVGDGLYGVDLKQPGEAVYVIEVNDNPSIERGVEDGYLGEGLYRLIMQEFVQRLEQRGKRRGG